VQKHCLSLSAFKEVISMKLIVNKKDLQKHEQLIRGFQKHGWEIVIR